MNQPTRIKDPLRITSLTRVWRKLRRVVTRNEWAVWLLGLSRHGSSPTEPGLILIQIDGLSQTQLQRAMDDRRMPFLKSLLDKEHYRNHTFYSGLPSSTPSVQCELYYGTRTVVPAFGFRDHRTGRLVRMFANELAQEIETQQQQTKLGLLTDGSSYGNIYGGGANDVHFCATSFGWSEFLNAVNPIKLALVMLLNGWTFFRVLGLMVIEFFLSCFDFVRGILSGRQFWQELIMIPARVVVVVLLRELVTVGACYDATRGVPVIHLNLLGYDEQAHRRGPGSRFAHWTLRAIDNSIRRIWNSAHRGAGREYDVWVFSDHGQETTQPYQLTHGKLIQEVVAEMVEETCAPESPVHPLGLDRPVPSPTVDRLPTRADWVGIGWLASMLFGEQDHDIQTRSRHVQTVTSGPLGFVYLLTPEAVRRQHDFASRLVHEFHVPMTVQPTLPGHAEVSTAEGTFQLPRDAVQVFGADHPFLSDVAQDMIQLAHHADSGQIVLVGWTHQVQSTSFVMQNGAHAGPGIEETRAFALLPADIDVPDTGKRYLRPDDLRVAALRLLRREQNLQLAAAKVKPSDERICMMTYNVHACVGMDGELSPERVARVIAQAGADIICLQELDVLRHRSGLRDQAEAIARHLEMTHAFHPAWHLQEEKFGNAILSRLPLATVKADRLHHHKADRSRRSALWVEVQLDDGRSLQVINTHMSIYPAEQLIQAQQLIEEWVQPASLLGPVVLCGDFNARPRSRTHRAFAASLQDVESFDTNRTRATLFSPFPLSRVDHVFVCDQLAASNTQVIASRLAKVASDHLPLVVDLKPR